MIDALGFAAHQAKAPLAPFRFQRRSPGPHDIVLELEYCGICHSDIHMIDDDWGIGMFPMVAGHEIIGRITQLGAQVSSKFAIGDYAGVGCLVDSCRHCAYCASGDEHYCAEGFTGTMNHFERNAPQVPQNVTRGGFSNVLVVDEHFALKIPHSLDKAAAAPLLCAGITTYSAMRKWHVGPGKNIGVVGLGGLGHMALKFAKAFGANTTLFTSRPEKAQDAFRLGATAVESSVDPAIAQRLAGQFDYIIDTVSAPHDLNAFLQLLKPNGVHCMVGMPNGASPVFTNALIYNSRSLSGSQIGGLRETQEMLDFCGQHNITADIEQVGITDINKSFERMHKGDVKYRFVVDLATLKTINA
jgi:uncharacterized zinc-type alcohol dehydrogenase-like protein